MTHAPNTCLCTKQSLSSANDKVLNRQTLFTFTVPLVSSSLDFKSATKTWSDVRKNYCMWRKIHRMHTKRVSCFRTKNKKHSLFYQRFSSFLFVFLVRLTAFHINKCCWFQTQKSFLYILCLHHSHSRAPIWKHLNKRFAFFDISRASKVRWRDCILQTPERDGEPSTSHTEKKARKWTKYSSLKHFYYSSDNGKSDGLFMCSRRDWYIM